MNITTVWVSEKINAPNFYQNFLRSSRTAAWMRSGFWLSGFANVLHIQYSAVAKNVSPD